MRAAQVTCLDGPDALEINDVDSPAETPSNVIIDVQAAGVNFPDLLQTRGEYQLKPPLPFVLGSEVAGVVRSAPAGSRFSIGDRLAAFPMLGGLSESVSVDPRFVFPLPDGVDFIRGAALPMNYLTVHFAFERRAKLTPGEAVLVQGAAGGVGTAACQYAAARGARVIAVVSTDAKAKVALAAGAHEVVPADGFRDAVKELTNGRGVDLVVDPVGGDRFTDSLRCLAPEGRLLVLGFTGREIPTVKVNRLLLGNTSVMGVAWGEYWFRNPDYLAQQWADLVPMLEVGDLAPVIGATYPLVDTGLALKALDERTATGKLVITIR